ncbi:MAG: pepsin/retropepsin-like aspartic protease family protein [Thermoanaerobaculia bacterium]
MQRHGFLLLSFIVLGSAPVSAETRVPFELVHDQIVLEVSLGDSGPFAMLLDTGVDPSVVDLGTARTTGRLESDEPIGYAGGVGSEKVALFAARLDGVRIGELEPEPFDAVAMDLEPLARKLGRPLHGILGYSFLRDRSLRIDYPSRTVTFDPPPNEPGPHAYAASLELVPDDTLPLVRELAVDGTRVPVSIDTGSSLVLELYTDGAARAGVEPTADEASTITGARGEEEVRRGRVGRLELGPLLLEDQDVTLSTGPRAGSLRQGNLGNGFLRHFALTLDYPGRRLVIEPSGPAP